MVTTVDACIDLCQRFAAVAGRVLAVLAFAFPATLAVQSAETAAGANFAPRRLAIPREINRVVPHHIPGRPTELDLRRLILLPVPLVPTAATSDTENALLAAVLIKFAASQGDEAFSLLTDYAESNRTSPWFAAVLLNGGILAFERGYFSVAHRSWKEAWDVAKGSESVEVTHLANEAFALYLKLSASLGRKDELKDLLLVARGRKFQGTALVNYLAALEGYTQMQKDPGVCYRCGSFALVSVKQEITGARDTAFVDKTASPEGGFSLADLQQMSREIGIPLVGARRSAGSDIVVPSVVHWKLNHYGAIMKEVDGRYLLQDPTFRNQFWISKATIDHEASGAFLVPLAADALPTGWSVLGGAEASAIFGKGETFSLDPGGGPGGSLSSAVPSAGSTTGQGPGPCGMPVARLQNVPCSIVIEDIPGGYSPAFGPQVPYRLTYHQLEADHVPGEPTFTSFGPLWESEFIGYIEESPNTGQITIHFRNGGSEVSLLKPQPNPPGGIEHLFNFPQSDSTVWMRSSSQYVRYFKDGTRETYGLAAGSFGRRKVFLTEIIDRNGHALTFVYDTSDANLDGVPDFPTRLRYIVDATGLATELKYDLADHPYMVTQISDPFERAVQLTYGQSAGAMRLQRIRDIGGLESFFEYDANGIINAMVTPYGRTAFEYFNAGGEGTFSRYAQITDPEGGQERIEYHRRAPDNYPGWGEGAPPVAPGINGDAGAYLFARNVYHWDKKGSSLKGVGDLGGF